MYHLFTIFFFRLGTEHPVIFNRESNCLRGEGGPGLASILTSSFGPRISEKGPDAGQLTISRLPIACSPVHTFTLPLATVSAPLAPT